MRADHVLKRLHIILRIKILNFISTIQDLEKKLELIDVMLLKPQFRGTSSPLNEHDKIVPVVLV